MEVFFDGAEDLALLVVVVDPPKLPKPPDTDFLLLAAAADLVELVSFKKSEMFKGVKKETTNMWHLVNLVYCAETFGLYNNYDDYYYSFSVV